jgi:hypothetical protein
MTKKIIILAMLSLASCSSQPEPVRSGSAPFVRTEPTGLSPTLASIVEPEPVSYVQPSATASASAEPPRGCPPDSAEVKVRGGSVCVDLYEIPNVKGAKPLVMIDAYEAEAWCAERGKTVVSEEAWLAACEGPEHWSFPYGNEWEPGRCNDDKRSIGQKESLLNLWLSGPDGRAKAQAETDRLWQGVPSGEKEGCVGPAGVYDLVGNVEEWVVAKHPKGPDFKHVLKGRFWAGGRYTCQKINDVHADKFYYYEVGSRCQSVLSAHVGIVQNDETN